jgi:imidazolonepropionase-like amidohydrolase
MTNIAFSDFEELQRALNPHREDEIRAAMVETAERLRRRGVKASRRERPDELADLLSAIERFEAEVVAHGGDLFVDDLRSTEPDDRHFVLPARKRGENTQSYIARINEAREELKSHPYQPGD